MRKLFFLAVVTVFLFLSAIPLRADDTVLFTAIVSPDALIGFDLSGSMGSNPGGDYNYQVSHMDDEEADCTDEVTYPTYDVSHHHRCVSGGHIYSNSQCTGPFYDWSGGSHSTDCSKLAIAKRTIFDLLDDNDDGQIKDTDQASLNTRFGYMRFRSCTTEDSSVDYNSECNTLQFAFPASSDPKFFDYSGVNSKIQGDTLPMTGYSRTPLAGQLKEAKKYLDDHKAGDTAKECRKKFIILVTDGWDTCACGTVAGGYTAPEYQRRRATLAAVKPIVDAGYQVFVVGFGSDMPQTEGNTLEWVAYHGGTNNPKAQDSGDTSAITPDSDPCNAGTSNDPGSKNLSGYAFMAKDATALGESLQTIIKWIREKAFTFTAPTVPSVRLTDTEYVYISSLTPNETPFWSGDLKNYKLNADGTLPVGADGFPSQDPIWEAQINLKSTLPGNRNIYTAKSGSRVNFTSTNVSDADLGISGSTSCNTECQNLINHVRGYDPYDTDQDGVTTDTRDFKLGDIFHSQAVIVGAPSTYFIDDGFSGTGGFYDTKKNRTKVLFSGANDGMLHAFDATTGAERWAFIPPSLLTSLKTMKTNWDAYKSTGSSGEHLYYVDGSPRVSDVWFYDSSTDTSKSVDEWRTVLINGLRKGGKTYFALDITNTTNPVYLWEFPKSTDATTLALVGQSWSDPTIGRVKIEVGDALYERWVAFIGGGWDANEGKRVAGEAAQGRAFFVVDIKTGEILWQFKYDAGDAEKQYMKYSLPATPAAVDTDADGYVDRVYIGDLAGQVWVFDLSFNPTTKKSNSLWSGKRLFKSPASPAEKHNIYYQVAVAFDKNAIPWVFFGTGDRENPLESGLERFYAVKDDGLGNYPRVQGDMANVTSTNTFVPPVEPLKGWTINLTNYREQALARPVVFNNLVYFTTFSPRETDTSVCTTGGTARLYVLHYLSGGGALEVDALSDLDGSAGTRSKIIGSGLPSAPSISINAQGQATIIVGTTESQIYSQKAFSPTGNKQLLYWRDVLY